MSYGESGEFDGWHYLKAEIVRSRRRGLEWIMLLRVAVMPPPQPHSVAIPLGNGEQDKKFNWASELSTQQNTAFLIWLGN